MSTRLSSMVRRAFITLASLSFLATTVAVPFNVSPAIARSSNEFPTIIPLPNGWQPEGIVIGHGTTFYVGSLANGAIFRGDLRTGQGTILAAGQAGQVTVGLAFDRRSNYVFAAGGPTGNAYVFDGSSGALLATYLLSTSGSFINDAVVTRDAAYFTDSSKAALYRVPLGPGGALPDASQVQTITLGGDFVLGAGFNANGIDATPDGKWLVIVQSNTGFLFRVDPLTGTATQINLGGVSLMAGDGIFLDGKVLYVVRNQFNEIAVVRLNNDLTAGTVLRTISDPNLHFPTTIDEFGDALYVVNAHFDIPPTPTTPYEVVRVDEK